MSKTILLVDDDRVLRRSLAFCLEKEGYCVRTAESAEAGLAMARHERPDLVLHDIGFPDMDGLEALRFYQREIGIPLVLLTARRREIDEVLGLELGADDYITKPYNLDVLLARLKNVLRRSEPHAAHTSPPATLTVGDLVVDSAARTVHVGGRPVDLPSRAFDLLATLASRPGHVISVDDLLTRVWGAEYAGEPQVVYVHIRWLRERIERDPSKPSRILTVRGSGYKLVPQPA